LIIVIKTAGGKLLLPTVRLDARNPVRAGTARNLAASGGPNWQGERLRRTMHRLMSQAKQ